MRIGVVLENWDSRRGGLERWSTAFVRWLLARGCSVDVLSRSAGGAERNLPVRWHRLVETRDRGVGARAADAFIREAGCDSVHDLGVGTAGEVLHLQAGCRAECRRAELAARTGWDGWKARWSVRRAKRDWELAHFERWQVASARGLLVVPSRRVADDLARRYGVPLARVHIVPNAADTGHFRPADPVPNAADGRGAAMVFLAGNAVLKGLPDLLRALSLPGSAPKTARLAVAGVGDATRWRAMAARLGIGDRVDWLGRLDDVRPLLHRARMLVHPSRYDAGSLVLWEAWSCGRPVIASPRDGSSEAMTDGREGWLLPAEPDPRALAACLSRAFAAPDPAAMSAAARALAERNNLEAQFRTLFRFHEERAGAGPRGQRTAP